MIDCNCNKGAPLVTTPTSRSFKLNYNPSHVLKKAEYQWLDGRNILDLLGISILDSICPYCQKVGFEIIDEKNFFFCCKACNEKGGGIQLIQHTYSCNYEDAVEKVGRILGIREKESFL